MPCNNEVHILLVAEKHQCGPGGRLWPQGNATIRQHIYWEREALSGSRAAPFPIDTRGLQRLLQTLVSKHFQALSVQNPPRRMSSILSPVVETHW